MQHTSQRRPGLRSALLAAAVSLLALAPGARAQIAIRAGQTLSGALTTSSPKMEDGSYYQLYTYRGRAGEHLTVTLKAAAFDAYLAFGRMQNGTFVASETDDDSGGGTDARIEATLPADGDYYIRANTLSAGETGAFTLQVASGTGSAPSAPRPSAPAGSAVRGEVRVGQTVRGTLSSTDAKADDDSYYQLWSFQGRAGQTVTIDLKSGAFDAYLGWGRMQSGAFSQIESDDDAGGGTDARLVVTPSADGTYYVRANTLSAGETGAYTLSVAAGGTAPAPRPAAGADSADAEGEATATHIVGSIRPGTPVSSALSASDPRMGDESYYRDYTYQGRAGERLVVVMRSGAFDSYLHFGRLVDNQFVSLATDDDGAGGNDSRIEMTLPADGTYVVRANSLAGNATGAFTLSLTSTR